jgi:predicted nucleic acid-binding protein
MLTCEAVITEACHLMQSEPSGKEEVLALIERGVLKIDFSLQAEAVAVKDLMAKYKSAPMDFADGCVVRMSETVENATFFTLDGDFRIYRKNGKDSIPLIIPDDVRS